MEQDRKKKDKNTDDYLAVGISLGVAFGLIWDNLALGLGLGVAFGLLAGRFKKKRSMRISSSFYRKE